MPNAKFGWYEEVINVAEQIIAHRLDLTPDFNIVVLYIFGLGLFTGNRPTTKSGRDCSVRFKFVNFESRQHVHCATLAGVPCLRVCHACWNVAVLVSWQVGSYVCFLPTSRFVEGSS